MTLAFVQGWSKMPSKPVKSTNYFEFVKFLKSPSFIMKPTSTQNCSCFFIFWTIKNFRNFIFLILFHEAVLYILIMWSINFILLAIIKLPLFMFWYRLNIWLKCSRTSGISSVFLQKHKFLVDTKVSKSW